MVVKVDTWARNRHRHRCMCVYGDFDARNVSVVVVKRLATPGGLVPE